MIRAVQLGKLVTGLFWAVAALNMVKPFPGELGILLTLGPPIILGLHTFEAFFFIRKFKNQLPELSAHAVQVLIFGAFHWVQVTQEAKTSC